MKGKKCRKRLTWHEAQILARTCSGSLLWRCGLTDRPLVIRHVARAHSGSPVSYCMERVGLYNHHLITITIMILRPLLDICQCPSRSAHIDDYAQQLKSRRD